MDSHEELDEILKESLPKSSMTDVESDAIWMRIEAELQRDNQKTRTTPHWPRRGLIAGAGLVVVLLIAVAVGPRLGGESGNSLDITRLDSASASEVIEVTADSATSRSFVPGPSQALFYRIAMKTDQGQIGGEGPGRVTWDTTEEWIKSDGKGVRIDGYSEATSSSDGATAQTNPNLTRFDANEKDERLTIGDTWRALFTFDELERFPTNSDAAIERIRRAIVNDATIPGTAVLGIDFQALIVVSNLLMEAPLTGDQRAALYQVLATAPEWFRSDGSADAEVSNDGASESEDGRKGILISTAFDLTKEEASMVGANEQSVRFEILVDPKTGSTLETRIVQGESDDPSVSFISKALELRDAGAIPDENSKAVIPQQNSELPGD